MKTGNMQKVRVAIVQVSAGGEVERNLRRLRELTAQVRSMDLIALPEVFAFRGADKAYRSVAEPPDGNVCRSIAELARDKKAWVLAGSVIEKDKYKVYNTSVLFDRTGAIAASYRKIHLFEASLDDGTVVREKEAYGAGRTPVLAKLDGWRCGFSVCYDLRFPELYRHYAKGGAHVLFVPSNFTQRTGKDHWELLVRARAIENQCYVIAPNQCGANPATGVVSHGHSMVVGPWGEILCEAGTKEAVLTVELDPARLAEVRRRVPALEHRVL